MVRPWIRRVAQPRYIVPVAGWFGCAFLLKFMFMGMAGQGMIQPAASADGQMAVLGERSTVGTGTLSTAAATVAPPPASPGPAAAPSTPAAEPADGLAEIAKQDGPEVPI